MSPLRPLVRGIRDPQPRTPAGSVIYFFSWLTALYSAGALFRYYVADITYSYGPSMFPTVPTEDSYTIYSRRHRRGKNVRIGDLITFDSPIFKRQAACKRIIGMPGDYVLRDPPQAPTAGGAAVPPMGKAGHGREEPVMIQVPEGHVWVAGDNMAYSRDSRFYGPLPMALITGKVLFNGDGLFSWKSFRGPQLTPVGTFDDAE